MTQTGPEKEGGTETVGITENTLLDGRVRLRQPRQGYRVAIDPVMLAAAVRARPSDLVLDVGTGTGAAALCLATRVPGCRIVGLEIQPRLARLAEENALLNDMASRLTVLEGDLRSPPATLAEKSFDHVMANPPYLEQGKASRAREPSKALADMEGEADLDDWVAFCARTARSRGTVTMVHRADRLDVLLTAYRRHHLGAIVIVPLWPKRDGRDARRVIVSGSKRLGSPLRLTAGLVLHQEDGAFTPEADAVLRGAEAMLV